LLSKVISGQPPIGQKEVPLPVEAWKRDSGSDGRRSRDLSIFSHDRGLDGKPKARQIPAFIWPIGVNVIKEVCSDLLRLWAKRGQTPDNLGIGFGRNSLGERERQLALTGASVDVTP
jgi:hypothetical protein